MTIHPNKHPLSTAPTTSSNKTIPEDAVVIGVITQPHGIRGELKIYLFNPESDILSHTPEVLLRRSPQSRGETYKVLGVRQQNRTVLLRLHGCNDRNHAEQWRGAELLVHPHHFPELPDDEFYLHELPGLPVYHADTGESMGEIQDVLPSPGHSLLVILYQGREVLVPLVEEWVPLIDLENKRVEISPIPGLFDDLSL